MRTSSTHLPSRSFIAGGACPTPGAPPFFFPGDAAVRCRSDSRGSTNTPTPPLAGVAVPWPPGHINLAAGAALTASALSGSEPGLRPRCNYPETCFLHCTGGRGGGMKRHAKHDACCLGPRAARRTHAASCRHTNSGLLAGCPSVTVCTPPVHTGQRLQLRANGPDSSVLQSQDASYASSATVTVRGVPEAR